MLLALIAGSLFSTAVEWLTIQAFMAVGHVIQE
jgi:hypothetical protein